jgi:hypothetical protein
MGQSRYVPINPERVLRNIPKPAAVLSDAATDQAGVSYGTPNQTTAPPQTPVTPTSIEAVSWRHNLIRQDAHALDQPSRQRLQEALVEADECHPTLL